jgi:hypothetical protein
MKDVLPIYLPSVTIAGDVVSLIVQRPEQWVAYEAALNGKVDRDGSGDPDILPGVSLDFASGSSINFLSNDGKLLGINSLVYKGEEADTRFVNAAGDNMTGQLTINGNKVWHAGNDGSGSGLDADLLDGKDSSFFTNAGNLSSGIVPVARLSGTYDINISGNAATATKLATARTISLTGNATGSASFDGSGNVSINTTVSYASDADTVDGKHASSFVQKAGDTMTGNLTLQGTSINIQRPETSGGYARGIMFYSKDGSTREAGIGMYGVGDNPPDTLYMGFGISPWSSFAGLTVTPTNITFKNNKVWHAGNDGSGSGLDADLLDGQHGAFYQNASNLNTGVVPVARLSGTYGISITGNAATATNADKLDGYYHDAFVKRAGDTMTGALTAPEYRINDANTKLLEGANNSVRVQTNYGYTEIGPQNTSHAHFMTDRASFYFNKPVLAESKLQVYATNTYLTGTEGKIAGNTVWHAGNDGSGSGLDADLLDGKHWSDIKSYIDSNSGSIVAQSLGTNGYVKFNTGLMIQWGTGTVYGSNSPQTKNFPFPFPNAAFVIRVGTNGSGWSATVQGNVINRLQYSVAYWNHGAAAITYSFIAIGY